MSSEKKNRFTVISNIDNRKLSETKPDITDNKNYHSNPMYEKLLNFRNLQEQQKKKFSVDDLFKLC